MKVECSQCGHLGPAADVRQGEDGVEVVCEECGAANRLDGGDEDGDGSDPDASDNQASPRDEESGAASGSHPQEGAVVDEASPERRPVNLSVLKPDSGEGSEADPSEYGSRDLTLETDQALDRLVPEQGPGIRCPKCAKLLRADVENCKRCGLNIDEAHHYDDGEAPWEQPPEGKDAEYEQADLLWGVYEESGDPQDLENFVEFVDEHLFYEMAIRRLQFRLVDHPDDEAALEALGELAGGVQSRIAAARAQAEANAEELNKDIKKFKRRVAAGIIVVGAVVLLVIVNIVW